MRRHRRIAVLCYRVIDPPITEVEQNQEEKSLMTFEGQQIFGRTKILEKIQGLGFQKICHSVTIIDCQPMFDGGILISVLGQLKTDDDPAHTFNQVFVLKPIADSFYVEHDVFRLALHHTA
ncbi:hypothetical protein HPB51_020436 [Rhipicephalus microplus]|uniref:Nuclear transport factor 2 n=1 Tax=Rhipicephalus microplus TaxID=6941 RepID=A0A9J6DC19_RHIMP|nr:hypothetical protein HPB51_020436 [Rhipicephalus microplus]